MVHPSIHPQAGRGPVLGDMTYGCAYWPADRNTAIGNEGYDDSKALTAEKRSGFFNDINAHADIGCVGVLCLCVLSVCVCLVCVCA